MTSYISPLVHRNRLANKSKPGTRPISDSLRGRVFILSRRSRSVLEYIGHPPEVGHPLPNTKIVEPRRGLCYYCDELCNPARPLSDVDRDRLLEAIRGQRRPSVTVLSSLLAAQDELHYIAEEAIEEVATLMKTTINEVWGVASFYTNFRFTPPGLHTVEICWGPTCHLEGAAGIIKVVLDQLELEGEGEAADNSVTFKFNTCLGACAQAPLMSIDHRLIGYATPESAMEMVSRLQQGG